MYLRMPLVSSLQILFKEMNFLEPFQIIAFGLFSYLEIRIINPTIFFFVLYFSFYQAFFAAWIAVQEFSQILRKSTGKSGVMEVSEPLKTFFLRILWNFQKN